jgi:ATP-dependent RNA helicase DHX29
VTNIVLNSSLEDQVFDFVKRYETKKSIAERNGSRTLKPSFKRLNALYVTLENFGFEREQVEQIMKANVGYNIETMLEWACLNTDHELLPSGFSDKTKHDEHAPIQVISLQKPQGDKRAIARPPAKANIISKTENLTKLAKGESTPSQVADDTKESSDDLNAYILNNYAYSYDDSEGEDEPKMVSKEELKQRKIKESIAKGAAKRAARALLKQENEEKLTTPAASGDTADIGLVDLMVSDAALGADDVMPKVSEDEDIGIGMFFDTAEISEVQNTKTIYENFYKDLSINQSWTGRSPVDYFSYMIRKRPAKLKSKYKANHNFDSFPKEYGFSLLLKAGLQKNKADVLVEADKPCRCVEDAKNLIATKALYVLFKDQALYLQLPEPFKTMWRDWRNEESSKEQKLNEQKDSPKLNFVHELLEGYRGRGRGGVGKQEMGDGDTNVGSFSVNNARRNYSRGKTNKDACKKFKSRVLEDVYKTRLQQRMILPIMSFEDQIVEAVLGNSAVVITGETGCGKSTQVPHLVLKAMVERQGVGETRGDIVCTQPRRISATSIARRVSFEMGDDRVGAFCGYSIRGESKQSKKTLLHYCTTGVLLRRLQSDPMLSSAAVVIVDEVHERSMQSDFLLIALRKILLTRKSNFCVVLMSATMDSEKVSSYFYGAPIIAVPGRTFPVSVSYLEDIIESTGFIIAEDDRNAGKMHRSKKVSEVKIRVARNVKRGDAYYNHEEAVDEVELSGLNRSKYSDRTCIAVARMDTSRVNFEIIERLLLWLDDSKGSKYAGIEGAVLVFLPGVGEISALQNALLSTRTFSNRNKYLVVGLHSVLSMDDQIRAFETPPKGVRKIVLSTNIAETGVTIPDVVFVIDTCLVKETRYNEHTRIRGLVQCYIPQSSGKQRQGRAGRVREGFCFRTVTKKRYEGFSEELTPELLRVPLDELCLNIIVSKSSPQEYLANALDPPNPQAIEASLKTLLEVGAINSSSDNIKELGDLEMLPLGYHLSNLPTDVRIGKMIILSSLLGCVDTVTTIAAALAYKSPFLDDQSKEMFLNEANPSDHLIIAEAYNRWENTKGNRRRWCKKHNLSGLTLNTMRQMKREFLGFLKSANLPVANHNGKKPNVVLGVIAGGLWPNVALATTTEEGKVTVRTGSRAVHLHPSSVCHKKPLPQPLKASWVVFHTLIKTSRYFIRDTSLVSPQAILLFCGNPTDAQVAYGKREIIVSNWIKVHAAAKCAVLISHLRQNLNNFLLTNYMNPSQSTSGWGSEMLNLIVEVLEQD